MDGWLLYDFRDPTPWRCLAGVTNSGTRRWFLWIPADGVPQLLVHAIEVTGFAPLGMAMTTYIGWQDLEAKLAAPPGRCGASPWNTAQAPSPTGARWMPGRRR
ncbi:MAG: hypothetical protein R3A10_22800 [Caldilineaceae bacterium]